jgi:hypothetical protein
VGCSLECVRRLVTLACEARGAVVVSWTQHAQGYGATAVVVSADGDDSTVHFSAVGGNQAGGIDWTVSSERGSWDCPDYPDNVCHATALAIGDS